MTSISPVRTMVAAPRSRYEDAASAPEDGILDGIVYGAVLGGIGGAGSSVLADLGITSGIGRLVGGAIIGATILGLLDTTMQDNGPEGLDKYFRI